MKVKVLREEKDIFKKPRPGSHRRTERPGRTAPQSLPLETDAAPERGSHREPRVSNHQKNSCYSILQVPGVDALHRTRL
jgi:hypothetical protein